jgi:trehalose 6-phosphate phosphatase
MRDGFTNASSRSLPASTATWRFWRVDAPHHNNFDKTDLDSEVPDLTSHAPIFDHVSALDPGSVALLLDVDGTLIDIAPRPFAVHVPDVLRMALADLDRLTAGGCALVSGRPIADLDRLFAPLQLSAVGAHGAQLRIGIETIDLGVAPLPEGLRSLLAAGAASGLLVEDKGVSVTLHYRDAPQREAAAHELAAAACAAFPGEALDLLPGKAMIEIKRASVNKGEGVRALMARQPFAGRRPVFIGDDVTDESVFAVLPHMNGLGFSVDRRFPGLAGMFETPAQVRAALRALAAAWS